jgi:hypothetical protein
VTADAKTIAPSKAELQVAYLRKAIVSFAPVLLAGLLVLSDAVNSGHAIGGVTWVSVVLAIAQSAGTFFPSTATAKLAASLAAAIGAALLAAFTDGGVSLAEGLLIGVQFLAWASAGAIPNGAHPDVVLGELAGPAVDEPVPAESRLYRDADFPGQP